jgi:DNA polymerase-3 subunit gamma/tau
MESLALKYRPKTFDDVVEQSSTKVILQQQLASKDIKNAYLFCGSAGTGKTTCARIFASEINEGKGTPIELDAASNNSVDDVRDIIQQSKTASLDSEYKIFIMDEVHALSNNAWQAMLKILEEPPKKSIFIMCTTEKNKVPKTILSRVQQFDFQRISQKAIINRLVSILSKEFPSKIGPNDIATRVDRESIEYIAKLAQGGMRDALTMLDKCLAYSNDLTLDNVLKALGIASYEVMTDFLCAWFEVDDVEKLDIINKVYMSGFDLKQFIKEFTNFVLDCQKFNIGANTQYLNCPTDEKIFTVFRQIHLDEGEGLLKSLIKLQTEIKWDINPKSRIEAWCITGE